MTYSEEEATRLVQKALAQEAYFNQQIHADQAYLLSVIQDLYQNATPALPHLQASTLARIDRDLDFVQKLNTHLQTEKPADATWSLKTNKMTEVLTGAKEILFHEENLEFITQGKFPTAFEALPPHPVHLGGPVTASASANTPYGNSQITYFSAALAEVSMDLLGEKSKMQDIPSWATPTPWVDKAHIAHVTPLPNAVDPEKIDAHFTDDFSFYFSDLNTPQGLAFIHSGYAFGGHRLESRYEGAHEKLGPEDCSSWLAKITECAVPFSTVEQLYVYRLALPESERGYVDPHWIGSERAKAIQATLDPVIVKNPLEDIHAGQVFAYRTFSTEDHQDSKGNSGHTALVLDLHQEDDILNVLTLGFSRNMPDIEGFGIQAFPVASDALKETMFFNVLPPIEQLPEIAPLQGDW